MFDNNTKTAWQGVSPDPSLKARVLQQAAQQRWRQASGIPLSLALSTNPQAISFPQAMFPLIGQLSTAAMAPAAWMSTSRTLRFTKQLLVLEPDKQNKADLAKARSAIFLPVLV